MDVFTPAKRSMIMARIRSKNTMPELAVRRAATELGYRYRLHAKHLPGKPDLVFPGRKGVVFVHGCFWHGHRCERAKLPSSNTDFWREKIGKNKLRDRRTKRRLTAEGWKVLTVWQCQIKNKDRLAEKLTDFLEEGPQRHGKRKIS